MHIYFVVTSTKALSNHQFSISFNWRPLCHLGEYVKKFSLPSERRINIKITMMDERQKKSNTEKKTERKKIKINFVLESLKRRKSTKRNVRIQMWKRSSYLWTACMQTRKITEKKTTNSWQQQRFYFCIYFKSKFLTNSTTLNKANVMYVRLKVAKA